MLDDITGMRMALEEAKHAYALGEVPIGAVIIDKAGTLIARGCNLRETQHDATAHAELIAIRRACKSLGRWRLTEMTLYVTIEPCPMCAGAIVMSRISRIVYGSTDRKAGGCESLFNITSCPGLNHQPEICAGILADECSAIIKNFFKERRKHYT